MRTRLPWPRSAGGWTGFRWRSSSPPRASACSRPAQIAERLRDSLAVLAAGRRTALTRQQTLTATLDWSHELLDDDERTLFRRLGAFAGSCDLDAMEALCECKLNVLARLVDKSLVVVEEQDGVARYRLLDTVRHYARERLAQAGEPERLEARHRSHYLRLAEQLEQAIDSPDVRRRLASEAHELRRALLTALRAEPDVALRFAGALWRFWHDRGDRTEGARWIEEALRAAPERSARRARALHGLSVLALRTSDHRRALATAEEAVAFFQESGDRRALSEELHHMGTMAWVFSDFDGAERWCEESRMIAEEAAEPAIVASVVHTLGVIAASRNDTATAGGGVDRRHDGGRPIAAAACSAHSRSVRLISSTAAVVAGARRYRRTLGLTASAFDPAASLVRRGSPCSAALFPEPHSSRSRPASRHRAGSARSSNSPKTLSDHGA